MVFQDVKASKSSISDAIIAKENTGVRAKQLMFFCQFQNIHTLFSHIFFGIKCTRFAESSHYQSFKREKLLKNQHFVYYFSKAKTEEQVWTGINFYRCGASHVIFSAFECYLCWLYLNNLLIIGCYIFAAKIILKYSVTFFSFSCIIYSYILYFTLVRLKSAHLPNANVRAPCLN